MEIGLSQIPRILGLMDRKPNSKTYGCFDRYYWHYKILDFPNIRFQEAVLALAVVYLQDHPVNRYKGSRIFREWVKAGVNFWAKARHKDGSLDESYPFERHFCATAMSCYSVTEALLLLNIQNQWDFTTTGNWLIGLDNIEVGNQMAGAAAALFNIYLITNNEKYRIGYEKKLKTLLAIQGRNGFFPEYGGLDVGYCSITLSFLAALYSKTRDEKIKESANKCLNYIKPFIDDDGYYNPNEMSRKTQFLYPSGLSFFAESILNKIVNGLKKNVILNPSWMDDRYCVPFTVDYLMVGLQNKIAQK